MPDVIDSGTQTIGTVAQNEAVPKQELKTARDWFRDMRFNADVNKSTIGVETDRITPELMLGTAASLLRISRGLEEPSAKDSLAYQRFYGPAEYFAEHIQRDQGKLARGILWKATNKGNLDFIGSNMLEPHISSVFYDSNLAQYLDGTTPFLAVDLTFKTTRVGLGGIASTDNAPDEMRTVQPSYYGFVDPVRCYSEDTLIWTKQGWISVQDMNGDMELGCLINGHMEYHKPTAIHVYDYNGLMLSYTDHDISYCVTPNHRMYTVHMQDTKAGTKYAKDYKISDATFVQAKDIVQGRWCMFTGTGNTTEGNLDQRTFVLPAVLPTLKHAQVHGMPPQGASLKNMPELDICDFAEFMGWYLALGSCYYNTKKSNYRVDIAQDPKLNPEKYDRIRDLVMRLPFGITPPPRDKANVHSIRIYRKQLYKYCLQFGDSFNKYIPEWIFTAPLEARLRFRLAMLLGDGRAQKHLCTVSKQLAIDFARLQMDLGLSVTITKLTEAHYPGHPGMYVVYWRNNTKKSVLPVRKRRNSSPRFELTLYNGKVYCPTVPGGVVYVRRCADGKLRTGVFCGNSPERSGVGLSGYMTKNVLKGSDGKLYQRFINARTGKLELVDSVTAANSVVSSHDVMEKNTRSVFAHGGKTGVRIVNRLDVDYYLPRPDDAYSTGSNMVTMLDGIKLMRLLMGCLHPFTPMLFIDKQGLVHIEQAKNTYDNDPILYSCMLNGADAFIRCDKVITRLTNGQKYFYKVVTSSGRVLITSQLHKWVTLTKRNAMKLVKASSIKTGMRIPRKLFMRTPVQDTYINHIKIDTDIAVLLGRIQRTMKYSDTSCRILFPELLKDTIKQALVKLGCQNTYYTTHKGIPCAHIKDVDMLAWILTNMGTLRLTHRVPSCILSALPLLVASYLDSYSKLVDNVGMDGLGDIWLMDLDNELFRTSIAFLLSRIGTDTLFRDIKTRKGVLLALKLVPMEPEFGDCAVDTVVGVAKIKSPGYMIDFDANDDVYAVGHGIITHNSKYATQAVPLLLGLVPLVQSIDRHSGKTIELIVGRKLGARFASKPGVVSAVRLDRIDIVYDDGTKGSVLLYKNFPANIKGFLTNRVLVKAGDRVKKDQIVAASNFTDDNGVQAMGRNLRVGYISYKGGTYLDACVLSESAAKKLSSRTMYKTNVDLNSTIRTGKNTYTMWKPQLYKKDMLLKLDDDGVVKVGQVLHKGDPMVLAVQVTEPSPGTMGKRLLTDKCLVWEHAHPGVVTDVVKTRKGIKVYATVDAPVLVGDKLSGRYGNKATAAMIIPDDQMPRDSKGRPLDMLMSPLGIVSRCYDKDTLFLTRRGWMKGADVLRLDLLYAFDTNTGTGTWSKQLLPMYSYTHTGILYSASNTNIDLRVTKNHTVVYKLAPNAPYRRSVIQLIFGKDVYMPTVSSTTELCSDILVRNTDWRIILGYDARVYCPTVATGFVLVRRSGKCVYSGNTNPSQLIETQLGKIALKLGHPIEVNQFLPLDKILMVKRLSKLHNVPMSLDVYDPDSGRTLKGILTGRQYVYKLKHMALSKMSARGTATYTAEQIPAGGGLLGSKRFGGLLSIGLIGHGAFDALITDAKLIRGQSNADFWRKIRVGLIPTIPGLPLVHKKFFAHLQGSGMRIRKTAQGISIFALTNSDVKLIAGNRLVKTRDTYLAKTFKPMDSGLFGTDIFGLNGDRWGYIQLDEPVLNPVMEQPIARLLQLPLKKLLAVLRGKLLLNGKTGSTAVKLALLKVDLLNLSKKALALLKAASKSKKDAALKRYVAIERMRRIGVHPTEFMLLRIPVLPPQFRPITSHSGLTMVADSNYLYAQLIDARDDLRAALGLPKLYKDKARTVLYDKWKLLVGLYEPLDRKLKLKSVKGLLKWALGEPAKYGAFQRKVFGSIVDTVGRGVVMPNSRLKLNQVGLPLDMAWNIYAPFVTRALVQAGYSSVDALKATKAHAPVAKLYLTKAMQLRPVIMNRAPSLHKLSLMGFLPVLVTGHAIHVHPSIVVPFGMDFDGDSVCNLVMIWVLVEKIQKNILKKSKLHLTLLEKAVYYASIDNQLEANMIAKEQKIQVMGFNCSLADLPVVEGSEVRKSDTVTEWDVVPGVYTHTVDPVTGKAAAVEITKVSKHSGLTMYDCKVSVSGAYSNVITASEDHSLITYNPTTMQLEKTKPQDAKGRCVPRVRYDDVNKPGLCSEYMDIAGQRPMSYKLGMFLGIMLGDGWVDSQNHAKIACCDESLQKYITEELCTEGSLLGMHKTAHLYEYDADLDRFSQNKRGVISVYLKTNVAEALGDVIGKGAENKHIPPLSLIGSRAHMIGILMGMLATDGSVSYSTGNTARKAATKTIAIHTISPMLRDGIQTLCRKLGIRTHATPYMGANSKSTCYAVTLSLEDFTREARKDKVHYRIPMAAKQESMERIIADVSAPAKGSNSYTIVPFPRGLFCEFSYAKVTEIVRDPIVSGRAKGFIRRDIALRIADKLETADWKNYADPTNLKKEDRTGRTPEQAKAAVDAWIALVRDENTDWAVVEDVTPSTCTEGWDCTVPGPYTFALSDGTVVQDTVNIHAPVSRGAVRDIKDKMMPLRNLISMASRSILYKPLKEYIQGLYLATRTKDKPTKKFKTLADARQAYTLGTLDVDDPILIG